MHTNQRPPIHKLLHIEIYQAVKLWAYWSTFLRVDAKLHNTLPLNFLLFQIKQTLQSRFLIIT